MRRDLFRVDELHGGGVPLFVFLFPSLSICLELYSKFMCAVNCYLRQRRDTGVCVGG